MAIFTCSILLCILNCVLLLGSAAYVVFVVPKFVVVFEDLDAELPQITVLLLTVPPMAWAGILLFGVILLALKEILVSNRTVTLIINGIMLLFALGWIVFLALALNMPFHSGINGVT